MKVGLVYNDTGIDRARALAENPHGIEQLEVTVKVVADALEANGHTVTHVVLGAHPGTSEIMRSEAEVFFNLTTGIVAKRMQLHAIALLEMCGVPFVGSDLVTQGIALDKYYTKVLLHHGDVHTPPFQRIPATGPWSPTTSIRYPAIIKPCREGSSLGITPGSIVTDIHSARAGGERMRREFEQDLLLEELAPGREFTVGILGHDPPRVFPIQEILYEEWPQDEPEIYSFDAKVGEWAGRACPATLTSQQQNALENMCCQAVSLLGIRDLARIDIRMDREGVPALLEINALPGLQPVYSEYPRMAEAAGLTYEELIESLVSLAANRGRRVR